MDFTKLLGDYSAVLIPLAAYIAGNLASPLLKVIKGYIAQNTVYAKALRVAYATLAAARTEYVSYFNDPNVTWDDYVDIVLKDVVIDPTVNPAKLAEDLKAITKGQQKL